MSWDIVLLKEKFDTNDKDYLPPTLGKRIELISQLTNILPNLDFSDESWGIMEGDGFSIEFNIGNNEDVDSIMLHIRGGGNPIKIIQSIMQEFKWESLDCSTGDFMELNNVSNESWTKFQTWRDKIFKRDK
ncbi:hypothetical protein H0I23_08155 [Cellulophaga sp. HaHaR_3_176]|uniref:hypothetical protein n=1 Tax=unclassified Cellulophaga TaxID=2634405 RepID=UPI001C1F2AD9|nr:MULTISPECIES: hypothetical protein [unclassified Cellulophaga]QWX85600.1 hypothetical protein H0I23_08155 [Cellulophaga sp. HaHaR_3_176]QXP57812.1 hypothetical protein H0I25_08540 [Cellulophaga sp. HaHa_2_95]